MPKTKDTSEIPNINNSFSEYTREITRDSWINKSIEEIIDQIKEKLKKKHKVESQEDVKLLLTKSEDDFKREATGEHIGKIKIRKEYYIKMEGSMIDADDYSYHVNKKFDQMVLEEGLETDTTGTKEIESRIRETLKKFGKEDIAEKFRVCISKRTDKLKASCYADGTIVISQELINQLGSLDLVMGVIFHEVSHYEEKHFKFKHNFIQEISADTTLTTRYLDESGLNSTGLLKALGRLEAIENRTGRSLEYLSFMQRRDLIRAQHEMYHFKHSNLKLTELSEALKQEAKPSNEEIINKLQIDREENIVGIESIIPLLSKNGLYKFIFEAKVYPVNYDFHFFKIQTLIETRMKELNCTEEEIKFTLSCLDFKFNIEYQNGKKRKINSQEEILSCYQEYARPGDISKSLFSNEESYPITSSDYLGFVLRNITHPLNGRESDKNQIKIDEDILIKFLEKYVSSNKTMDENDKKITISIINYISMASNINTEMVKEFFDKVNKSKLSFLFLPKNLSISLNSRNYKLENSDLYSDRSNDSVGIMPEEESHILLKKLLKNISRLDETSLNSIISASEVVFGYLAYEKEKFDPFEFIKESFEELVKTDDKGEFQNNRPDLLGTKISELFDRLNFYLNERDENNNFKFKDEEREKLRLQFIKKIFEEIEKLPFADLNFSAFLQGKVDIDSQEWVLKPNLSNLLIHEYITEGRISVELYGDEKDSPKPFPEINSEYLNRFRNYSVFSLKLRTLLNLSSSDNPDFYQLANEIMENSGIPYESFDANSLIRLIQPLLLLNENGQPTGVMQFFGRKIEKLSEKRIIPIRNIDLLEKLPFVSQFLKSEIDDVPDFTSAEDAYNIYLTMIQKYQDEISKDTFNPGQIFDSNLIMSKLFSKYRLKYIEFLSTAEVNKSNYQIFYELTLTIFPHSQEKREILSGIRRIFLEDETITFEQCLNFLEKFYEDFTYQEILKIVEKISSDSEIPGTYWKNWIRFMNIFEPIQKKLLENSSGLEKNNKEDIIQEAITPHEVLKSAIKKSDQPKESINDFAQAWLAYAFKSDGIKYDENSQKFVINKEHLTTFNSLRDFITLLKSKSLAFRMNIVKNGITGEMGLIRSEEGREELGQIINEIFEFDNNFITSLITNLCESAEVGDNSDFFVNSLSYFAAKDLFRNLDVNLVNPIKIKSSIFENLRVINSRMAEAAKLAKEKYYIELPYYTISNNVENIEDVVLDRILKSSTFDIKLFGIQYAHSKSTLITPQIQQSERDFQTTRTLLSKFSKSESIDQQSDSSRIEIEGVPRNIELLIQGLEQTILGTRSIQIAGQLIKFDSPAVNERVARSFDAAPGMDRLRFLLALTSIAETDENFKTFLETKLVDIVRATEKRDSLGGASMATVFKAKTIDESSGDTVVSAIRCLIANPEKNIDEMFNTLFNALELTANKPRRRGESRHEYNERIRNARIMKLVLSLAEKWCIDDLADPLYEVNDDRFRESVVSEFLIANPDYDFVAPQRIYTSKVMTKDGEKANWVRVEGFAPGVSIRKFLDDMSISEELKAEVINQIYEFNMFQYNQKPKSGETVLIQSDPSIGNYHVEILPSGKPRIHILDRGFMLEMDSDRAELFRLFIEESKESKIAFIKTKLEFLKKLVIEVRKNNTDIDTNSVHDRKILFELIKKGINILKKSKLFTEAVTMSDVVLAINEAFTEVGLKVPINIQLPIKNISGWKNLKRRYPKKNK